MFPDENGTTVTPTKTEGSGDLSRSNKEEGMIGIESTVTRPCVADRILGAYRPAIGRPPSDSGSSVTMDNEDHLAAASGHAHDQMDASLQAYIRRNHRRSRWPARTLYSTRPTKERSVALGRAGGTSRQHVATGLRRRDGGLRRTPIGDVEGPRMQRDSLARKFLGLLDELASRMDTARA